MSKEANSKIYLKHCMKSVSIQSFSGPHFYTFGLNMERYYISLRIQSKCRKIRTRKTLSTDTFHAVKILLTDSHDNVLITKVTAFIDFLYCSFEFVSFTLSLEGGLEVQEQIIMTIVQTIRTK